MASVYLIDDQPIVRVGLKTIVDSIPGCRVCGQIGRVDQAVAEVDRLKPDLVVVDLLANGQVAFDFIKSLRNNYPKVRILLFSTFDELVYAPRSFSAGAHGFVKKTSAPKHLTKAITTVLEGKRYLSADLARMLALRDVKEDDTSGLSDKELEVFTLMGQGHSNKSIASLIGRQSRTVETHKQNIRKKLNFSSMKQVNLLAVKFIEQKGADSQG